jgi:group I intron endonuclease
MKCKSGIYKIEHVGGKVYVGSAVNIHARWRVHMCLLNSNKHHSKKLQRAWNKYGLDEFSFTVIETVEDKSLLVEREQYHIDVLDSFRKGFNSSPTAGSTLGKALSEEARKKIAVKAVGRKHSKEAREKMSLALMKRKGEKRPEHTRRKIAEKAVGRILSEETRRKMSEAHKKRKKSPEHMAKIISANKARAGLKAPLSAREKMSLSAKKRVKFSVRGPDGRFCSSFAGIGHGRCYS